MIIFPMILLGTSHLLPRRC